ncbi:MAG: YkvA family protein [Dehalococcoidia bacterium]
MGVSVWLAAGLLLALLLAAGLAAGLTLRRSPRGRRFWRLSTGRKLAFGRFLIKEPQTPRAGRILLTLLVAYLLLPIDLVPDFVPVLGHLDDLLVAGAVLVVLLLIIPGQAIDSALSAAEQSR